jgi:hypothetical protein
MDRQEFDKKSQAKRERRKGSGSYLLWGDELSIVGF